MQRRYDTSPVINNKKVEFSFLKGTATLMISMLYTKDLNKPCILIPVSSKSVDKRRSC